MKDERISICEVCKKLIKHNKDSGRKYKYCSKKCLKIAEKVQRKIYYAKNIDKIRKYRLKYRQKHQQEIIEYNREWNKKYTKEKHIAKEKLLDDMLANPRKYLKRV